MRSLARAALAAALTLSLSAAAHAASLSYDFTAQGIPAGGGAKPTYAFSSNGVTLDVTAQYTTDVARTLWSAASVYRTDANGLGVQSPSTDANNAMIDAVESNERLLFNFSDEVTVLSVSFKNSGTNDQARIGLFDGATSQVLDTFFLGNSTFVQNMTVLVPNAKSFYLEAIPSGAPITAGGSTDWFSVSAMTAQTQVVPLPAAAFAGLPLLGLFIAKRRRAAVAA